MNLWLLGAAALSAFTCGVHVFLGGREVARPLLKAEGLGPLAKYTAYYCWHLVTIAIGAQAAAFAYASVNAQGFTLAAAATAMALAFCLWSVGMVVWLRLSPLLFPQWALFLPAAILGFIGMRA